jgi:hypothetical protein
MVGVGDGTERTAIAGSSQSPGAASGDLERQRLAVATVNGIDHVPGHDGVTPACPISCMGLQTVADLLSLLANVARMTGLRPSLEAVGGDGRHMHERVTPDCPITCLNLSEHVLNPLKGDYRTIETVRDLLRLAKNRELKDIRNIGPRRLDEIRAAFIMAGFSVFQHPAMRGDA